MKLFSIVLLTISFSSPAWAGLCDPFRSVGVHRPQNAVEALYDKFNYSKSVREQADAIVELLPYRHGRFTNDVGILLQAAHEAHYGEKHDYDAAKRYRRALMELQPERLEDLQEIFAAFATRFLTDEDVIKQATEALHRLPPATEIAVWTRVLSDYPQSFIHLHSLEHLFGWPRLLSVAQELNRDGSIERACNQWMAPLTSHLNESYHYPAAMEALHASLRETGDLLERLATAQHPLTIYPDAWNIVGRNVRGDLRDSAKHAQPKRWAAYHAAVETAEARALHDYADGSTTLARAEAFLRLRGERGEEFRLPGDVRTLVNAILENPKEESRLLPELKKLSLRNTDEMAAVVVGFALEPMEKLDRVLYLQDVMLSVSPLLMMSLGEIAVRQRPEVIWGLVGKSLLTEGFYQAGKKQNMNGSVERALNRMLVQEDWQWMMGRYPTIMRQIAAHEPETLAILTDMYRGTNPKYRGLDSLKTAAQGTLMSLFPAEFEAMHPEMPN